MSETTTLTHWMDIYEHHVLACEDCKKRMWAKMKFFDVVWSALTIILLPGVLTIIFLRIEPPIPRIAWLLPGILAFCFGGVFLICMIRLLFSEPEEGDLKPQVKREAKRRFRRNGRRFM